MPRRYRTTRAVAPGAPVAAVGVALVLIAGGTAAVVTSGGGAAAAAERCVAWAAMPARVTLTRHVMLRPQLLGTAGCRAGSFDNGATAALVGPGRDGESQRWDRFGDREQIDLYRDLDRPGRYTIRSGDVQAYDRDEERIPASWRSTSVVVKYGASFGAVRGSATTSRATLRRWTADGKRRSAGTPVMLQRHRDGHWTTVARARTARDGTVRFTHRPGSYRLVSAATAATWGAVATLH